LVEASQDPRCLNKSESRLRDLLRGRDCRSAIAGLLNTFDSKIPEGHGLLYDRAISSEEFDLSEIETFLMVYDEFQPLDPTILEVIGGLRRVLLDESYLKDPEFIAFVNTLIKDIQNRIRTLQRAAAVAETHTRAASDRFSSRRVSKPSSARPSGRQRAISQSLRALRDQVGQSGFRTRFLNACEQAHRELDPVIISQLFLLLAKHHKKFPRAPLLLDSVQIGSLLDEFLLLNANSQTRANVAHCLGRILMGHNSISDIITPLADDPNANIRDLTDSLWGLARLEVGREVAPSLLRAFLKKSAQCAPDDELTHLCISLSAWSGAILRSPPELLQALLMFLRPKVEKGKNIRPENIVQAFHVAIDIGHDVDFWTEQYLTIRSSLPQSSTAGRTEQVIGQWIASSFPDIPGTASVNRFYYGYECDVLLETPHNVMNIEIDGTLVHSRLRLHDAFRDRVLQRLGVKVLRIQEESLNGFLSKNDSHQRAFLDQLLASTIRESFSPAERADSTSPQPSANPSRS